MLREIKFILKDEERERHENQGCRLVKCCKCSKEFYSVGRKKLCKACQQKKNKRKLLDEQYRIAARLGLLKHKLDNKSKK